MLSEQNFVSGADFGLNAKTIDLGRRQILGRERVKSKDYRLGPETNFGLGASLLSGQNFVWGANFGSKAKTIDWGRRQISGRDQVFGVDKMLCREQFSGQKQRL